MAILGWFTNVFTRNAKSTDVEVAFNPDRMPHFDGMPHFARVAFAARCARRIQPLFRQYWPDAGPEQIHAIEKAIRLAEQSAATAMAAAEAHQAAKQALVAGGGDEVTNAIAQAAGAAATAVEEARCGSAYWAWSAFRHAADVAERTSDKSIVPSMHADFALLMRRCGEEKLSDTTPVNPDAFGPLAEPAIIADSDPTRIVPTSAEAYCERGRIFAQRNSCNNALADFEAAIRLEPTAAAFLGRASVYQRMQRWENALADCDRAVQIDPESAECYRERASCLESLYCETESSAWLDRAVADYTQAIRLDPAEDDYFCDRGVMYSDLGRYPEAIADFTEYIKRNPSSLAYQYRGDAYLRSGQAAAALEDFNEAIKLDPDEAEGYALRAQSCRQLGDIEQADRDERRARELGRT